jgi:hypothetical protein
MKRLKGDESEQRLKASFNYDLAASQSHIVSLLNLM